MTAILPDMVIKVTENLRDSLQIEKLKQREETVKPFNTTNSYSNKALNSNDDSDPSRGLEMENLTAKKKQFEYEEPTPVRLFILPSTSSVSVASSSKLKSSASRLRNNINKTKVINTDIARF